jgi:hypothetical protein
LLSNGDRGPKLFSHCAVIDVIAGHGTNVRLNPSGFVVQTPPPI